MTGLAGVEAPARRPVASPGANGDAGAPTNGGDSASGGPVDDAHLRSNPLRLLAVLAALVAVGVFLGVPVLVIILALVVSIFAHEMGHFLAAKASGMKVTEFFIGMGPRIWSFRRGEVEYGLRAVPLGAYVRIIGMSTLEEIDPAEEQRTYRAKNYPRRLATVAAGPAVNIGIGVLLFFGLFAFTGVSNPDDWTVGSVVEGSAAETAGVLPGDRIVAVDGAPMASWEAFTEAVSARAGEPVSVTVERNGVTEVLSAPLGWSLSASGAEAFPTSPALPPGSRLLTINGGPVGGFAATRDTLAAATGPVDVVVEVAGSRYAAELPGPVVLPADGARGLLGITQERATSRSVGVVEAAGESVAMVGRITSSIVDFAGRLFSPSGLVRYGQLVVGSTASEPAGDAGAGAAGLVPLEPLGGGSPLASRQPMDPDDAAIRPLSIIGIVQVGDQLSGEGGLIAIVSLLAIVNLFLGLFNLLPLPPFDGGHIMVATYEAVRGSLSRRPYRADMNKLMPVTYVVVALLLVLGLSTMWLDITNPIQLGP